ncbi:hypothetical protein BD770DRAFT_446474 [Pilaira anomala]|nr:hypothetical protein BD770DRAFT_446474 [Pilaira anomala]
MTLPDLPTDPSNFDPEKLYSVPIQKIVYPGLKPDVNDPNNYCAACDRKYPQRSAYMRHLSTIHIKALPELHQGKECKAPDGNTCSNYCKECGGSKADLAVLKYLGQRPNVDDPNNHCTPCDKAFSSKRLYRTHLTERHDMKLPPLSIKKDEQLVVDPLQKYCNVCDKPYRSKINYREHVFFHHHAGNIPSRKSRGDKTLVVDEVNFFCNACDRKYHIWSSYRDHLRRVHKMIVPVTLRKFSACGKPDVKKPE